MMVGVCIMVQLLDGIATREIKMKGKSIEQKAGRPRSGGEWKDEKYDPGGSKAVE